MDTPEEYKNETVDAHPDQLEVLPLGESLKKKNSIVNKDIQDTYLDGKALKSYFCRVIYKTTTGSPTSYKEGDVEINTADNKVRIRADGAWRQLATW